MLLSRHPQCRDLPSIRGGGLLFTRFIFLESSLVFLLKLIPLPLFGVEQVLLTQLLIMDGLINEAGSLAKAHTLIFGHFFLTKLPEITWSLLFYHH